jgi:hypothetical protein
MRCIVVISFHCCLLNLNACNAYVKQLREYVRTEMVVYGKPSWFRANVKVHGKPSR